ncbi:26S proteasome non-ATPase regulatory subunit 2 homolog A [Selaginella moellendorffii]|uniref:26S proteasome non-ATPase regulatory subunit 2 homolog A n=1 Tax=Selaginella moellendorffii TaxID=88036 RepID=UPI000D1C452F|nr:26S proteasome non-ATPase regulatory subunit 2 homolog A [Selaginella moellendorffii]|eukprot:XP_024533370.1 26S proteasome non-ATPase regulatory subunit 2 homolog A [Selaginella moellendorffii]
MAPDLKSDSSAPQPPAKPAKDAKKKKDEKEDLSEEDLALKQQLELYVERAQDSDPGVQRLALESMRQEIRSATSSMTSVPKPLKFLRPHYGTLKAFFQKMPESELKMYMADIISVLALTMSEEGERESLQYRLLGSKGDLGSWGHEYVRNLAGEIGLEFQKRRSEEEYISSLMDLVKQIVPFHLQHNAEPEAVDLLMEVETLDILPKFMEKANFKRTCSYLLSCASYVPELEDISVLDIAYQIYSKFEQHTDALRVALRLGNLQYARATFAACKDLSERKQLCYILARQSETVELDDEIPMEDEHRDVLQDIMNNTKLCEGYLTLARDLDVMEPKVPEDIYKAHLIDGRASAGASVDSARQNLAATFVNAFVNAGFGQDHLMTSPAESSGSTSTGNWLFKNKEHGKASATASLGLITLWDVDGGLPQIDKYLYSTDNHVVAGALLAVGIINCGIRNDCDPAYALLYDSVTKDDPAVRIGAIMGLGLAYAGTQKEEVLELLTPIISDSRVGIDVAGFAALSLGLVYVASCHEDAAQAILLAMMERDNDDPLARFLCLGLGLLYLGKQDAAEATFEVVKTVNEKISNYCQVTLESCTYAGTGNVLKVQKFLSQCSDHLDKGESHQGAAVLGIGLVAMAEELGSDMALRALEHLLQYGEPNIRRAVPLALGLLSISNPKINVMDTLSRLSHDTDSEVAMAATISLGLIGAGTNNARIAGMLRSLSSYYYKDPSLLFCVRIAQGLVHMGKGLITLNPYHSDRFLLSTPAIAGIVAVLHACLDMKAIILGKYHYVLYYLVLAMQPRMLMTVDENLKPLPVPVRVGIAVDTVGQAGRPKSITGFQTHTTPVLLATGERAELATEKYTPLSSVLEGFVVLRENPDYVEDHLN